MKLWDNGFQLDLQELKGSGPGPVSTLGKSGKVVDFVLEGVNVVSRPSRHILRHSAG